MNLTQAKLIIWNSAAYERAKVLEAVAFILGSLEVSGEDFDMACSLV